MASKRILTFKTAEVALAVNNAKASLQHRATFSDQYNPAYHKGGKVKLDGNDFPDSTNINPSAIPASLWLVKDDGVYLMSNAAFTPDQKRAVLAYAEECNPKTLDFDTWWDNASAIMGGDDCAESLPIAWFEQVIACGKPTFRLQILSKQIRLLA